VRLPILKSKYVFAIYGNVTTISIFGHQSTNQNMGNFFARFWSESDVEPASPKRSKKPENCKILFLGTGEAGKSTVFTQVRTIFDTSLPQVDFSRDFYRNFIFVNIIELTICALKRFIEKNTSKFQNKDNNVFFSIIS
jgi:hypothetical protein